MAESGNIFDLWVQHWRKHRATGEVIVVRYADDSVLGFQYRADAERFLRDWRERLQQFGLELHPDKTRLLEFGRFAVASRKQRGEGKPETFDFLAFTHLWTNAEERQIPCATQDHAEANHYIKTECTAAGRAQLEKVAGTRRW
jgi:hypothetical protein